MFNTHYINIVQKTPGVPLENHVIETNNTLEIIEGVIRKYFYDYCSLNDTHMEELMLY